MRVFLAIGLLALMLALAGCRDKGDKEPTVAPTVAPTPTQQQNFQPAQKQEKQQSAATPFQSPVSPVSPLATPQ